MRLNGLQEAQEELRWRIVGLVPVEIGGRNAELRPLLIGLLARKDRILRTPGNQTTRLAASSFQFYLSQKSENVRHLMVLRLRGALEQVWKEEVVRQRGQDIKFVWNEGED